MKDRLSEQKVQVRQVPGVVLEFAWTWSCMLHDCTAETRHGRHVLFEPTVFAADAHARRFHGHKHVGHDLPLRCVRCSAPVRAGAYYCGACRL